MFFMLARVTPNLSEAHVEKKAAYTGVGQNGVKDFAAFRIAVPAFVDIFADNAPGERRSVAVSLVDKTREWIRNAARVRFAVAQPRNEIAQAKESKAHHARAFGVVNQFVDPAGFETTPNIQIRIRRSELHLAFGVLGFCQLPLADWHRNPRVGFFLANSQRRCAAIEHGIALYVGGSAHGHRENSLSIGNEFLPDPAAKRLAVQPTVRE